MNFGERKLKLIVYLILSLIFTVATFIGIRFVITNGANAGYAIIPAIFSIAFTALFQKEKKTK